MTRLQHLFFFFLLAASSAYSQVSYSKGKIYTYNKDTMSVYIKDDSDDKLVKGISYKTALQESKVQTYSARDIKGFSLDEGRAYQAQQITLSQSAPGSNIVEKVKTWVFLRHLVQGELSLYEYNNGVESRLYVQHGYTALQPLYLIAERQVENALNKKLETVRTDTLYTERIPTDGNYKITPSYLNILGREMKTCSAIKLDKSVLLNAVQLTKLVEQYNRCGNSVGETKTYNQPKRVNLALEAMYNYPTLFFLPALSNAKEIKVIYILDKGDAINKVATGFQLGVNIGSARASKKLSFSVQLAHQKNQFRIENGTFNNVQLIPVDVKYSSNELLLLAHYALVYGKKISPYVSVGVEVGKGNSEQTLYWSTPEVRTHPFSYVLPTVGVGVNAYLSTKLYIKAQYLASVFDRVSVGIGFKL
jgi:hypothetical protein